MKGNRRNRLLSLAAALVILMGVVSPVTVQAAVKPSTAAVFPLEIPEIPKTGTIYSFLQGSAYLSPNGTLRRTDQIGQPKDWKNIVSMDAEITFTVGLRSNGTVVAYQGDKKIPLNWKNIVQVSASVDHILGLRSDGTVVAWGDNEFGQCDVEDWEAIVDISTGMEHSIGLKADGTVVAAGSNAVGQCDVQGWKDLVQVSADGYFTAGLRSDGTVVLTGGETEEKPDVSGWTKITAISAGPSSIFGLRADGTVAQADCRKKPSAQTLVVEAWDAWQEITAIDANYHLLAMRSDGTILATGGNQAGECELCKLQPDRNDHWFEDGACVFCGTKKSAAGARPAGRVWDNVYTVSRKEKTVLRSWTLGLLEETFPVQPLSAQRKLSDSNMRGNTADVGIGNWTNNSGVTVPEAIKFWVVDRPGYTNTEYIELELSGEHTTLLGGISTGRQSEKGTDMTLRIYLDGKEAACYTGIQEKTDRAFALDITGARSIRLECSTDAEAFGHCIVEGFLLQE